MKKLLGLFWVAIGLIACNNKEEVDILISAKAIYTVNDSFQVVTAVAINNGQIIELGNKETIFNKYSAKEIIDVPEKYIYPGFIDAHCHFSGYALDLYKCDLVGTNSYEEIITKLITYEKTNKLQWIYGRGWDQNDWAVKVFPTKHKLDSLFPNKPVILKRIDGHAVLCNQKALDMSGINASTKIEGGIVELANGEPTGILIDNATEPVEKLITNLPEEQAFTYLQQAEKDCYSYGLTGVVDCGVKKDIINLLQKAYSDSLLSIGNTVQLSSDRATLDAFVKSGPIKKGQLQVSGIKIYADGALGSRGACLLHDYTDMANHKGMLLTTLNEVKRIAQEAKDNHWQVCTHAIGDSANRTILKLYVEFLQGKNDMRWRIEHAQVVSKQDLDFFGNYNIIPSVQPTHATSDMPWAENRLGADRIKTAYSYKELLQQNGWIALGTDFPVEGINPLATFYAAVARKDKNGHPEGGFLPENALSPQEALRGITIWAAKSVFAEKMKGSLEVSKDADIVILDRDIMTVPQKDILSATVNYTLVKGKVKYKSK